MIYNLREAQEGKGEIESGKLEKIIDCLSDLLVVKRNKKRGEPKSSSMCFQAKVIESTIIYDKSFPF